jgi:hypothetical protein
MYDRRSLFLRRLRLALPLLLLVVSTGCGVTFSESFEGTELFKSIRLTGDLKVGSELTLTLNVNQGYPVPVQVGCYYEAGSRLTDDQLKLAFQERATFIGGEELPAALDHKPGDDVVREDLVFKFTIDEAGEYFLACLTPAAPENGLGHLFEIVNADGSPAATPTPGPSARAH